MGAFAINCYINNLAEEYPLTEYSASASNTIKKKEKEPITAGKSEQRDLREQRRASVTISFRRIEALELILLLHCVPLAQSSVSHAYK